MRKVDQLVIFNLEFSSLHGGYKGGRNLDLFPIVRIPSIVSIVMKLVYDVPVTQGMNYELPANFNFPVSTPALNFESFARTPWEISAGKKISVTITHHSHERVALT